MKRIVLHYLTALLFCFLLGVVLALTKFCSWLWIFAISIPISFGWIPLSLIVKKIEKNMRGCSIFFPVSFLILVGVLISCIKTITGFTFANVVIYTGLIVGILESAFLLLRLHGLLVVKSE